MLWSTSFLQSKAKRQQQMSWLCGDKQSPGTVVTCAAQPIGKQRLLVHIIGFPCLPKRLSPHKPNHTSTLALLWHVQHKLSDINFAVGHWLAYDWFPKIQPHKYSGTFELSLICKGRFSSQGEHPCCCLMALLLRSTVPFFYILAFLASHKEASCYCDICWIKFMLLTLAAAWWLDSDWVSITMQKFPLPTKWASLLLSGGLALE